jgi:MFS family permease
MYMLTAPLFGMLASRVSRWFLIGLGVILWSLASGASGIDWGTSLATAFWLLFLTRCFVGIGEAVYGPVAPAILSDLFSAKTRGQVLSWFYVAIPVGGALGYVLGETMAGLPGFGWRWAFYAVVPPGILLGVLSFFLREPKVGASEAPHPTGREMEADLLETVGGQRREGREEATQLPPSAISDPVAFPSSVPASVPVAVAGKPIVRHVRLSDYLVLLRTPSYVLNTLGMTGMTFAIGGLAYWMPDYLEGRQVPALFGVGPRTVFGGITVLAGLFGTLAGGWSGDALRNRFPGSYFLVSGAAMMLGFPMILLFLWAPFPMAWLFVFLAVFCLFFNTGPTNTILANVVHPALRSTGFAFNILIIHLLGDVPSPPLMGYISGIHGRDASFILVSLAVLVGGLFWIWGSWYLQRDTAMASARIGALD